MAAPEFTLLLFGWDDTVLAVESLAAADPTAARRAADALLERSYPNAAGWQLWLAGRKVLATFPQARADRGGRLRVITGNAPAN